MVRGPLGQYQSPDLITEEELRGYLLYLTQEKPGNQQQPPSPGENDHVTFRYRASDSGQSKLCTPAVEEFIHRFLQHVLPKGFVKVRYSGFLSAGHRAQLTRLRQQLAPIMTVPLSTSAPCATDKPTPGTDSFATPATPLATDGSSLVPLAPPTPADLAARNSLSSSAETSAQPPHGTCPICPFRRAESTMGLNDACAEALHARHLA